MRSRIQIERSCTAGELNSACARTPPESLIWDRVTHDIRISGPHLSYFGCCQARISHGLVVFGRILGRVGRIQIMFENIWLTLIWKVLMFKAALLVTHRSGCDWRSHHWSVDLLRRLGRESKS